jgi:hypothetical protein
VAAGRVNKGENLLWTTNDAFALFCGRIIRLRSAIWRTDGGLQHASALLCKETLRRKDTRTSYTAMQRWSKERGFLGMFSRLQGVCHNCVKPCITH